MGCLTVPPVPPRPKTSGTSVIDAAHQILRTVSRKPKIERPPEMFSPPLHRVADNSLAKEVVRVGSGKRSSWMACTARSMDPLSRLGEPCSVPIGTAAVEK
jgi:hypothetical protein